MKTTGLTDHVYVGGYDLSGDIGAVQVINKKQALIEDTGLDKYAVERLLGLCEGEIDFNAWYQGNAALGLHEILKALPNADRQALYFRGLLLGNPVACITGKQLEYSQARAAAGGMSGSVKVQSSGDVGLEWGVSLTPGPVISTSAEKGLGIDNLAGTVDDLPAYLQVLAFTGTDVTLKVEHSDDGDIDIPADDNAVLLQCSLLNNHTYAPNGAGYSPLHTRKVTFDVVDTGASIVAGTVTITGTDYLDDPLIEDVSIAGGAGSYETTGRFKTVIQVKTKNDVSVLDGGGDEKITVGVKALVSTYSILGAFAQTVLARTVQRVVFAGPVKQFLRASVTTAAGFTTVTYVIAVARTRLIPTP
jgi:hypothetical protein